MRIPLDRRSTQPLFRQIEQHLREKIFSGALQPGTRLPSTRCLAHGLRVNRITVVNAYAELEADGLVYTRLGSGTYVSALLESVDHGGKESIAEVYWPLWQQKLERQPLPPSRREMLNLSPTSPLAEDLISFAGGHGSEDLFPSDDFRKAFQSVLRRERAEVMGYGDREGYLPLRVTIANLLTSQGIFTHPKEILITSGSQQALALVAGLIIKAGDPVLVESPTYSGAIDLFSSLDAQLVEVAVDEHGMQVERVEEILRTYHPSLIYTIPNFQNPTGTCLKGERRWQLLMLAKRYNIPILEDEFVGDLRFEGRTQPALKALDPGGQVIYIRTFSKILMPGLRIGFIVASGPVYDQLLYWKYLNDLATSNLIQHALEVYITLGRLEAHLHRARRFYRRRRDAMDMALHSHMPEGTSWHKPSGGLFFWVQLPPGVSAKELHHVARSEGVEVSSGSLFYPCEKSYTHIRLNFATHDQEKIEEGIRRLGRAVTIMRSNQT
jgi:GntR family transcriptional regulator / MocR family aminotransferase